MTIAMLLCAEWHIVIAVASVLCLHICSTHHICHNIIWVRHNALTHMGAGRWLGGGPILPLCSKSICYSPSNSGSAVYFHIMTSSFDQPVSTVCKFCM